MLSRSAALRTSVVRAAAPRATPARIARRWESSSPSSSSASPSPSSTTKPAEDHSIGTSKAKGSPTAIIAGAFGLCVAGVFAFMMGNPKKAQDIAGKVSSDAQSKEHKFRRPTSTS